MNAKFPRLGPVDGSRITFDHKTHNININVDIDVSLECHFFALGSYFINSKLDLMWMSVQQKR